TGTNPSKTYTAVGPYTISLTNRYTSCTSSATKIVRVVAPATPAFTVDKTTSCSAPFTVNFTNQSTPIGTQWLWDFGDGTTSTDRDPSHTYNIPGNFDVKLTVTNVGGCSSTATQAQLIKVQPPTVVLNSNSVLKACTSSTNSPGYNVINPVLDITSLDGVATYQWSASGADAPNTSTSATPTFTYTNPGVYSLTVTITTNGGCSKQVTFTNVIQIGTPTTPNITITDVNGNINPAYICGRDKVTFSDPVTPTSEYQWAWDFGDGVDTLTDQPSIDHRYNNVGSKTVRLNLIHNGCTQIASVVLPIRGPIPSFSFQADCANDPFTVIFSDSSKLDQAPGAYQASWDFGDGTPPLAWTVNPPAGPTHTYTPADRTILNPYTVKLTMTDGVCAHSYIKNIELGPVPIDFTFPAKLCRDRSFPFVATSPSPGQIKDYSWQIDGGAATTPSSDPQLTNTFSTTGSHSITLIINDVNGCPNSKTNTFLVSAPAAFFTPPAGGCKNGAVTFTDGSTPYDPNDPTDAIIRWTYDFGDQNQKVFTTPPFTNAYADTGFFLPVLTVQDVSGCTSSYTAPAPIHITSPLAKFGGPDSFYCPKTVLPFKDSSIGFNLNPSLYVWDYGDGKPTDNLGAHAFDNNQNYTVMLTVTDQFGCTNSTTKTVRIQQPIAAFDISDTTSICVPLQTKFAAHGQFYDSLYWSFGDGGSSTLANTSHFYNTLDTFYAKLYLRGPGGCFDSATRRVLALDPNKTSVFTINPTTQCDSVPAQFNIVPPGYTTFTLFFGDNGIDSSQSTQPFHMYRKPATYIPVLNLTDATGCIVSLNSPSGNITVLGSIPFFG
ncbi:MAG: PKD domain-containing protein, partial [Bacteroidetes bacterium]|nr:PKD domain-containing protein [Bacteroidota bacterium]